ncbi:hypothetical protein O3G_MSEX011706 [Manduca sexta]|uniref:Ionotropic receptor 8a n=1 Tax=Manduca sexta TaxID=7130 RepID=A0A922CVL8_MANSE|nr:hypothetical protein O3G_MSEX011706 [Manduca sexta]
MKTGVRLSDSIVLLDRENEEESYRLLCSSVSKGVSMIVDISWFPWEKAEELSSVIGVPIVRTLLGPQQLVTALDNYLESRNATDAAIIVESEIDVDKTLYELLGSSNVRVWVHAGLSRESAKALKTMRPEPSFYAIVGDSEFVFNTYKRAVKEKLVRRNYRWNLVITDYVESSYIEFSQLILPTMFLQVDPAECCRVINQKDECSCPPMQAVPWTLPKLHPDTGEQLVNEEGQPLYEGYCIDLIEKLSEAMNFEYEIVTPKVGGFGKKLPNGTWDGVVGDLMVGETDIAVGALTMTAEREEVIDFVAPYFEQTGILIVIRKPIRKTSLFKFMTVLRTEVWLSIVAALVLTGFMIWLLEKYSPYSARNNPDAYPYPCREFTLKESFWFALTSFTPQGGGEAPKALSGRTLVAAYWLFVVLMLATFTANLAAFLTVERMQTPVSSLEQLARQSRINYTVVESSSVHQYFINMKFAEDTLYRVWKEITLNATSDQAQYRVWDYPIREQYGHILLAINASGPVPDAKTGFQQVNEHADADFAFIHDSAEIKYEVTRNCNLTEVGEVFAEQPYAIAVQQGSRLQEDISRALLELQKERFLEQMASKYWNETARQACPDADESEGITLESLGGVFIATLFGLGLAMITLAWEVLYYKRKEKTKIHTLDVKPKPKPFAQTKKNLEKLTGVVKLRKRDVAKTAKLGKDTVTIGDTFKPAKGVSYISVFPKNEYRP